MDLTTLLPIIGSFVRQGLAAGGGYLVAHSAATADQSQALQGGALALAAVLWSLYQKYAANKALKAAKAATAVAPKV